MSKKKKARVTALRLEVHVPYRVYTKQFWPGDEPMIRYGWTCMHDDGECGDAYSTDTPAGFPEEVREALR